MPPKKQKVVLPLSVRIHAITGPDASYERDEGRRSLLNGWPGGGRDSLLRWLERVERAPDFPTEIMGRPGSAADEPTEFYPTPDDEHGAW